MHTTEQAMHMDREKLLKTAASREDEWDVIVIGGGATGLGAALEAASRDYDTLLLEQHDFAKGTSSRSTKLVHGGVRYLQQGNVRLVREALRERGLLHRNAPHLVHNLSFIVPIYDWWEGPFYGIGLKIYDKMAGRLGLGTSRYLSREETLEHIPTLEPEGLDGGVIYHDAQFDDARLAVNLLQTLHEQGGTGLNYMEVTGLLKEDGVVRGVRALDHESGRDYEFHAKVTVNATGIFTDTIRRMDNPQATPMIRTSQGVHLVLDDSFQPGESAIMVPRTSDGRVLFAVPWYGRILVGTTDTPVEGPSLEPRALKEEVEFLLSHAAQYLTRDPGPGDVLSVFAGIRPLVSEGDDEDTSAISRDHTLISSPSGLVTITGGKWTTYRLMGEDTIDEAERIGNLEGRRSVSEGLKIHGWMHPDTVDLEAPYAEYGSDAQALRQLASRHVWGEPLHPSLPYTAAHVVWAVRQEMARSVEDVLARRTRALVLDARASMEMADEVAALLAAELGRTADWAEAQAQSYRKLAGEYLLV
ncbi:MAG: glycerol-3-phosphate dehydrogenase/oxidase [Balneolaceae bacterium]|nr:glycerol-3-phosphate dehydrogenase/oxidase [Balneolaceae bacterium]